VNELKNTNALITHIIAVHAKVSLKKNVPRHFDDFTALERLLGRRFLSDFDVVITIVFPNIKVLDFHPK